MKKIKFGFSFVFLVLICVLTNSLLLLINYISALLLHELAHVFIALKRGYTLKEFKICLFGVSVELNEKIDDKDSFAVNIAGPVLNLFLCLVCVALYWLIPKSYQILNVFCIANLTLAVFNLLPIYPLDGGKIFESFIEPKKYKKLNKIICVLLSTLAIIGFIFSCFYQVNWFLLLLSVFFISSKTTFQSKMTIFKYSQSKKIEKVELLKATGEETLFELLKKIKSKKYTIFYYNNYTPKYIDEDEIIELSTKFPLITKLKQVL